MQKASYWHKDAFSTNGDGTAQKKKKKKRFDLNITPEDKTKEKLGS